jgi:hypothetical protein
MSDREIGMADENEDVGITEKRKNEYRLQHKGKTLLDMVIRMREVEIAKEDLEDKLKELNAEYDVLRIDLIPVRMEDDGINNVRYADIGQVVVQGDLYVKVIDKEKLFGWFRKSKLGDLIQETVNASTLKAFIKRRIKEGKPYPDKIGDDPVLKITPFSRASINKSRA